MPHSIESVASTRKKTKETVRVESLLPDELKAKAAKLIELLRDYYTHVNEKGQASYALGKINDARDIDEADQTYLDLIQREIAITVPKKLTADKVKLYKNLMKYYSVRGSQESIELFFKILFNDNVEVYYPQTSMLIPSAGTWDQTGKRPVYDNSGTLLGYEDGIYTSNQGFLSDTIKLQDSFFYQKFSYVIRTGNNVSRWKDSFNRLVHPAGFIFFGEILVILELLNGYSAMPKFQPGLIFDEDLPLLVLSEIIANSRFLTTEEDSGTFVMPQFIEGETVTGQTSGATGRIVYYKVGKNYSETPYARGTLFIDQVDGDFAPGETIIGTESSASRTINTVAEQVRLAAAQIADEIFTLIIESSPSNSSFWPGHWARYTPLLKFFDSTPMYSYADFTKDDAINNAIEWSAVGSNITITP